MNDGMNDDLYGEIERRALHDLPEDEPEEEELDLVGSLRPPPAGDEPAAADAPDTEGADVTLGGYIELHNRVPAFEGHDEMPYTVDVDVEATGDPERPFAAFLMFIRWAATGAGIMDHVESGDVAYGVDEESARQAAYELSLYEVRAELDAAIARRRENQEPQE
jgi:hypothetical protein